MRQLIEQYEKMLVEIKNTLCSSSTINKLMRFGSNNALQELEPDNTYNIKDFIVLHQVLDETTYLNTHGFIGITLADLNFQDTKSLYGIVQIDYLGYLDEVELINNKLRPMEILKEICDLLNNKETSIGNQFSFLSFSSQNISDKIGGFTLLIKAVNNK